MIFEISLALNRKDSGDIIFLKFLDIHRGFWVTSHENLRSHLREDQLIDVALINHTDFSSGMRNSSSVRVGDFLIIK
jgi:hypothetical protein